MTSDMPGLQPPVDTAGRPQPDIADDHPPSIVYDVNGHLAPIEGAGQTRRAGSACSTRRAVPAVLVGRGNRGHLPARRARHPPPPDDDHSGRALPADGPSLPISTGTVGELADPRSFNGTSTDKDTGCIRLPLKGLQLT